MCNEEKIIDISIPDMRSIKATAKRFGLAEHLVRMLVLSGKVKAVRIGDNDNKGKILVNQQSLVQYFNQYMTD